MFLTNNKARMDPLCITVACKAFLCKLPQLSPQQLEGLHKWAESHCAEHRFLRSEGTIYLACKREKARNAKTSCRLFRAACDSLGIALPRQRKWLHLLEDGEQANEYLRDGSKPLHICHASDERLAVLKSTRDAAPRSCTNAAQSEEKVMQLKQAAAGQRSARWHERVHEASAAVRQDMQVR